MSKVKRDDKKRGTASWIWDFAGAKRKEYVVSVVTALIGVACSIVPYLIMIELIQNIIAGTATRAWCIKECIYMGMWWIARYAFPFNIFLHIASCNFYSLSKHPSKIT